MKKFTSIENANDDNSISPMYIILFDILFLFSLKPACKAEFINYKPLFVCSKTLNEPYGIVAHISRKGDAFEFDTRERGLDMIKEVGISNVRVDFDWTTFRRGNGKNMVSFEVFDKMMYSASKRKIEILGIISNTKKLYDLWYEQTDTLVKHFQNNVNYWGIVNEANFTSQKDSSYTIGDYLRLLENGYKLIKRNKKNGKVLYTGLDPNAANDFFEGTLRLGASCFFDIMNVHFYTLHQSPEILIEYYRLLKNKFSEYDIRKPVWLTECGYPTNGKMSVSLEEQAIRLPRVFLVSFACGVDKVYWYNSRASELSDSDRECHFGIFHKDYTPKPSFLTYKTLVQMCPSKSTRPKLYQCDNIYIASWKKPNEEKVWAIWTSKGEKEINLEVKGDYELYDLNGVKKLSNLQTATPSVHYIVGATILIFERNEIK